MIYLDEDYDKSKHRKVESVAASSIIYLDDSDEDIVVRKLRERRAQAASRVWVCCSCGWVNAQRGGCQNCRTKRSKVRNVALIIDKFEQAEPFYTGAQYSGKLALVQDEFSEESD